MAEKERLRLNFHRVHVLYILLSIFFIFQTTELTTHAFLEQDSYKKVTIDSAMIGVTSICLVVVGYFMLE